jgi:hypothetical protein
MEEIENRFEIIRIAVQLTDAETIKIQTKHLRNMSTDSHLHNILLDLESQNYRQALYSMRDYAQSLRDDFFTPPPQHEETKQPSQPVRNTEPAAVTNDLFNAPPPTSAHSSERGERVLGLEEMLQMTRESASTPRAYTEVSREAEETRTVESENRRAYLEARLQEQEHALEADRPKPEPISGASDPAHPTEADPLFTLDQEIPSEAEVQAKEEGAMHDSDPHEDLKTIDEEIPTQKSSEMTPLFATDEQSDDDFLSFSPPLQEEMAEEENENKSPEADTEAEDIFAPGMFELAGEPEKAAAQDDIFHLNTPRHHPEEDLPNEGESPRQESDGDPHDILEQPVGSVAPSDSRKKDQKTVSAQPHDVSEAHRPRPWEIEPDLDEELYEKFAYMGQKFRNMMHQYPQLETCERGVIGEVRDFIHMVSTRDYAESQVEALIGWYQELKTEGKRAEAAQVLIAAATTESTFAQFMLARELFKGEVLQQNYPEAFTQINRLAEEDCLEAICDLGQLYEYGIGIGKNKRHALLLYEEAADMGVERAKRHFERLKGSNPIQSIKSLTSSLLRKKK